MKVFIADNCQARSIARCLAVINPSLEFAMMPREAIDELPGGGDDLILRFYNSRRKLPFPGAKPNQILFPALHFDAFHPDAASVSGRFESIWPPLGGYQSALVLYGWHRGFSIDQTLALFTDPVFESLGFFDAWEPAMRALLNDGRAVDFALDDMFERWRNRGCFMHTMNHPKLFVIADLAREIARRADIPVKVPNPEEYVADHLIECGVWPMYPSIARRLGLRGAYAFKPAGVFVEPGVPRLLDLAEFVRGCYDAYAKIGAETLQSRRLEDPRFDGLENLIERPAPPVRGVKRSLERSPYNGLPDNRFWSRTMAGVTHVHVDPVLDVSFTIEPATRIASLGSCFAQNVSRAIIARDFTYYATEPHDGGPDRFSVHTGNIYTPRQMLQLFERAYGKRVPADVAWQRPDGRYVDPFRPLVVPAGFASVEDVQTAREHHLRAVRELFEGLEVLIVTFGLTEMWVSRIDGSVFPVAPGVVAATYDPAVHAFANATAAQVAADLGAFITGVRGVNPGARIVVTLSPQLQTATYEQQHVLVAATYTKAVLRAGAGEAVRAHDAVDYFPSYDVVSGVFTRGVYYRDDHRSVNRDGVERAMQMFFKHYTAKKPYPEQRPLRPIGTASEQYGEDAPCDEDLLAF